MHIIENRLYYTGAVEATVYFDADAGGTVGYSAETALVYRFTDANGREISCGCGAEVQLKFDNAGGYRLTFLPHAEGAAAVTLFCDDGC